MKILVLFYSFTGNTRKVASLLSEELAAERGEVTCSTYTYGFWGGIRQAFHVFSGGTPKIELPAEADGDYDLVVIGGPVWGARPAPPLRSLIKRHASRYKKLALFLTCKGTSPSYPPEKALAECLDLCPSAPIATHIFTEADVFGDDLPAQVTAFANEVRAAS